MLDPLSVLSLASAVITFIDLGTKIVKGSFELYRSSEGSISAHAELEHALKSFAELSARLSTTSSTTTQVSPEEIPLKNLAGQCQQLADEFSSLLQKLKLKGQSKDKHGLQKKWNSLGQAVKNLLKESQIQNYRVRLDELRSEFLVCMVAVLGERQTRLVSTLEGISASHADHEAQTRDKLDLIRHDLLTNLKECKQAEDDIVSEDDITGQALFNDRIRSKLVELSDMSQRMAKESAILSTLRFQSIYHRYETIVDAHSETFQWILSEKQANERIQVRFVEWLKSGTGIFWINGKAGCGKSTLMKFLCNHPATLQYLQEWAGDHEIVVPKFFFWLSGSDLQKSQEGLLRSLLHGILRKASDLIPIICEVRWQSPFASDNNPHHWTRSELISAFDRLATEQSSVSSRFCFFIDGLDEYKGDHLDIVQVVRKLSSIPAVKICVSSRPWNVFSTAFGSGQNSSLQLHELTHDDIRLYVEGEFQKNTELAEALEEDFDNFAHEIVNRAQGVFLWVFLVVRSLLRGAQEGDDLDDFRRRLNEIPTDLQAYFNQMLNSVEKLYHAEGVRILKICMAASQAPSVMTVSYFKHATEGIDAFPSMNLSLQKADHQRRTAQLRINARCKDFVEFRYRKADTDPRRVWLFPKVEFLHRTVRDFLENEEMQNTLASRDPVGFDVSEYLAYAYLTQIRSVVHLDDFDLLEDLLDDFFYYAMMSFGTTSSQFSLLMDGLEAIISPEMATRLKVRYCRSVWLLDSIPWTLVFALQWGHLSYVKEKLSSEPPIHKSNLLYAALQVDFPTKYELLEGPDPSTVEALLVAGADVNDCFTSYHYFLRTPWLMFLSFSGNKRFPARGYKGCFKIAQLFIEYGADGDVECSPKQVYGCDTTSKGINRPTAREIINFKFNEVEAARLQELFDMREANTQPLMEYSCR